MATVDTAIELIKGHGLWLLAPLAVMEGPIVTVIGGYLVRMKLMSGIAVYTVVVLADLVGDTLLYSLGRFGMGLLSPRVRERLGLTDSRFAALRDHFAAKGGRTLVFGKLTHSAGAGILAAAGAARMPFVPFIGWNLAGTLPKSLAFLAIGYAFGAAYAQIDSWIYRASLLLLALTAAFALAVLVKRARRRQ